MAGDPAKEAAFLRRHCKFTVEMAANMVEIMGIKTAFDLIVHGGASAGFTRASPP